MFVQTILLLCLRRPPRFKKANVALSLVFGRLKCRGATSLHEDFRASRSWTQSPERLKARLRTRSPRPLEVACRSSDGQPFGPGTRRRCRRLIPSYACVVSLKRDPDYQGRESASLPLKFYLCGLSGPEIGQIARFFSDPNEGRVGNLERPVPLPLGVVEARLPGINRGDLSS